MQYVILAPIDGRIAQRPRRGGIAGPCARGCCLKSRPRETREMDKAIVTCAITGVLTDPARLSRAGDAGSRWRGRRRPRSTRARASFTCISAGSSRARATCRPGSPRSRARSSRRSARPARRHRQPDDGHGRARHIGAGRLPARGAAGDRGAQRRVAQLSEDARRRRLGVAADAVRQSRREDRGLSRGDAENPGRCRNSNVSTPASCAPPPRSRAIAASQRAPKYNFVMGVESGMPADPDLLPILLRLIVSGSALERHRDRPRGNLAAASARRRTRRRSAHRPRGYDLSARRARARSNGELIAALVAAARAAGRSIASPEEARDALGLAHA